MAHNNFNVNIFIIMPSHGADQHFINKIKAPQIIDLQSLIVRTKGLEPPRRQTLDPKSSAATNYATCA